MKLFIFSCYRNNICREEIEVEEKEQIFVKHEGAKRKYYNKNLLDIFDPQTETMISLNGNPEDFTSRVVASKIAKAEELEKKATQLRNDAIIVKNKYRSILKNNFQDGKYNADTMIYFMECEDNHIKTNKVVDGVFTISANKVISGNEFLTMIAQEQLDKDCVSAIFIDGKHTNIFIEGYGGWKEDETMCVIPANKLNDFCLKAKIEIAIL